MKKKESFIASYVSGITDTAGERYITIFNYFWPELITAFIVSSLLGLVNSIFIGHLRSTELFVAQGVATNFLNFVQKIAEGLSIGAVILCGQHNGAQENAQVGRAATNALWTALVIGGAISLAILGFASTIYSFYGVSQSIIDQGAPLLKLRTCATFLSFVYFALVGLFRGVKNTRVPMICFALGSVVFIVADYAFIFGKLGAPQLGLLGAAVAAILQYSTMIAAAMYFMIKNRYITTYQITLLPRIDLNAINRILQLSWPVMVDKATMAFTKIWMLRLFARLGTPFAASYSAIQEMEMLAFIPAIAGAQVVTFLVSNDYGARNWRGIKVNIKKTMLMSSVLVSGILLFFSWYPELFFQLFDKTGSFIFIAAAAFPMVSVFVIFDTFQLILAGALRGAANVKTVMVTRLAVCTLFLFPASYICASMSFNNPLLQFIMMYGIAYLSDGIMGLVYILWFRSDRWKSRAEMKNIKGTYVTHYRKRDSAPGATRQPQA